MRHFLSGLLIASCLSTAAIAAEDAVSNYVPFGAPSAPLTAEEKDAIKTEAEAIREKAREAAEAKAAAEARVRAAEEAAKAQAAAEQAKRLEAERRRARAAAEAAAEAARKASSLNDFNAETPALPTEQE